MTSGSARDCYNPSHPLDRIQDRNKKIELLRYTTGLGLVTGSEDGADWAAPYLDYFEGMVMTRRFGYVRGVTVNTWPSKFDLDEEYKQINLNERVRAAWFSRFRGFDVAMELHSRSLLRQQMVDQARPDVHDRRRHADIHGLPQPSGFEWRSHRAKLP